MRLICSVMDTKTLKVGQDVEMVSGPYGMRGRVVKVHSGGVVVEVTCGGEFLSGDLIHFRNGMGGYSDESSHECGPWKIASTGEKR